MTRGGRATRVPGAAQHERSEVVRCRPGTSANSECVTVPDQRCTTSAARSRCTASGTRAFDRRSFLTLLAGAAASSALAPRTARAQAPALPVVGYLNATAPEGYSEQVRAFHQGLKESGYVEGENVAIDYRWGENRPERLPALAADLVRRRVNVIAVSSAHASVVAARATTTIPVVFIVPEDPVRLGLVTSLARPGGNTTGINFFAAELAAKRLELLRALVPTAKHVAVLLNPAEATAAAANRRDVEAAAGAMGLQIRILNASTIAEIDAAFATFANERPDALFVSSGPFFTNRRVQLAHLATRYAVPTIASQRFYPEVGGLMSYSASLPEAHRQAGVYAGRILKGAKPADLPVVQSTKFELVINASTARMLGLTVPPTLLVTADEVIE
jgi:putative tryptophan/tyrosine transport system substrate-binding protein